MGKSDEALKKCISDKHEFNEGDYLIKLQAIPYTDYLGYVLTSTVQGDYGGMFAKLLKVSVVSIRKGDEEAETKPIIVNDEIRHVVKSIEIEKLPKNVQGRIFKEIRELYEKGEDEEKN